MATKKPKTTATTDDAQDLFDGVDNRDVTVAGATFIDVELDDTSNLSPLVRRVQEMGHRAHARKREREGAAQEAAAAEQLQMDLFVADLLDYSLKDDTATMEAPLYSLSTKRDMETFRWTSPDKKKWLEVTPSSIGRATIHDKDLLIYLASQLVAAMNHAKRLGKKPPGRRISFTLHDFLVATGRDVGGKSYVSVESMIDRLSGTRLKTNMEMGNIDRRTSFGLIEQADYVLDHDRSGNRRMKSITVTLSEWFYRALEQKNVLTITPEYFNIRKPLEKRLYELARKHVGEQPEWVISESNLLDKSGSRANIREFRRMLKAIIADDSLPEYRMQQIKSPKKDDQVRFYLKDPQRLALAFKKQTVPRKRTRRADPSPATTD